jgi:hypothetical protein
MKNDTSRDGASITLDPRTEELLREIAADKESCLLRAPRRELEHALVRSDYRGVETTVGFSAAERELLRTARAEVAYWLNVVCFRRLTEDAATRRYCTRLTDGDREYVPASNEELELASRAFAADIEAALREEAGAVDVLLRACRSLSSPSVASPSIAEVASASLRLRPTYQARHYAVQAMIGAADSEHVAQLAAALSIGTFDRRTLAYAHAVHGTALSLCARPADAMQRYLEAAEHMPSLSEFKLRALVMALQAGSREHSLALAREVDDLAPGPAAVNALAGSFAALSRSNSMLVRRLAGEVLEHGGSTITRLLHENVES